MGCHLVAGRERLSSTNITRINRSFIWTSDVDCNISNVRELLRAQHAQSHTRRGILPPFGVSMSRVGGAQHRQRWAQLRLFIRNRFILNFDAHTIRISGGEQKFWAKKKLAVNIQNERGEKISHFFPLEFEWWWKGGNISVLHKFPYHTKNIPNNVRRVFVFLFFYFEPVRKH